MQTGASSPSASVNLSNLTYTNGKAYVKFNNVNSPCIGVYSTSDGVLVVHPVNNPEGENFPISLTAYERPTGIVFDCIIETGTTVTLANCYVFPLV